MPLSFFGGAASANDPQKNFSFTAKNRGLKRLQRSPHRQLRAESPYDSAAWRGSAIDFEPG
jgi:hypothetical protein